MIKILKMKLFFILIINLITIYFDFVKSEGYLHDDSEGTYLEAYIPEKNDWLFLSGKECKYGCYSFKKISFDCICIKGLWAFYNDFCQDPEILIGGNEGNCFPMSGKNMIKFLSLSDPFKVVKPTVNIFKFGYGLLKHKVNEKNQGKEELKLKKNNKIVVAGGNQDDASWTISFLDKRQNKWCLKPYAKITPFSFCTYHLKELPPVSSRMYKGCNETDKIIEPKNCFEYKRINPGCSSKSINKLKGDKMKRSINDFLSSDMSNLEMNGDLGLNSKYLDIQQHFIESEKIRSLKKRSLSEIGGIFADFYQVRTITEINDQVDLCQRQKFAEESN